jgi:hypothetical protein
MWRICYYLFGCHFVATTYGGKSRVRRVRTMPNGRKYIRVGGEFYWLEYERVMQGKSLRATNTNRTSEKDCTPIT